MLAGCLEVSPEQMPITSEQREFVYEYAVPDQTKAELFRAARSNFAVAYGNSREVDWLEDEGQGTIIGKAIAPWNLTIGTIPVQSVPCASNYNLVFIAKDGRARLELSLLEEVALPSSCGWKLPSKRDYPQVVEHFQRAFETLGNALHSKSAIDRLKNFKAAAV